jgi:large subunit ribosomal protein L14e
LVSTYYLSLQASPFRRFVQIGRVCVINFGRDAGKLCVIIDVINQNRALIDGPYTVTGVKRQAIPFKRLSLTDYVVTIPRNARQKLLTKAMKDADIMSKWKKSRWYKKNAAARLRARMTDFERFKVTLAKKRRNKLIGSETNKLIHEMHRQALKKKATRKTTGAKTEAASTSQKKPDASTSTEQQKAPKAAKEQTAKGSKAPKAEKSQKAPKTEKTEKTEATTKTTEAKK